MLVLLRMHFRMIMLLDIAFTFQSTPEVFHKIIYKIFCCVCKMHYDHQAEFLPTTLTYLEEPVQEAMVKVYKVAQLCPLCQVRHKKWCTAIELWAITINYAVETDLVFDITKSINTKHIWKVVNSSKYFIFSCLWSVNKVGIDFFLSGRVFSKEEEQQSSARESSTCLCCKRGGPLKDAAETFAFGISRLVRKNTTKSSYVGFQRLKPVLWIAWRTLGSQCQALSTGIKCSCGAYCNSQITIFCIS